jgi:hypothetical protein
MGTIGILFDPEMNQKLLDPPVAANVYSLWCRAKSCMLSSVPTLTHILPLMFPAPPPSPTPSQISEVNVTSCPPPLHILSTRNEHLFDQNVKFCVF